jgi:hypothetical protein
MMRSFKVRMALETDRLEKVMAGGRIRKTCQSVEQKLMVERPRRAAFFLFTSCAGFFCYTCPD